MMAWTLQLVVYCNAEQDRSQCVFDVNPKCTNVNARYSDYPDFCYKVRESNGAKIQIFEGIVGDLLSKHSLLYVVRYTVLNTSALYYRYDELYLNVTNDKANEDRANSTVPIATYVASRSAHHAALGPMTWDFLTLGAMDAAERTNVTTIILPAPPCPGSEETVYVKTLRQVRVMSHTFPAACKTLHHTCMNFTCNLLYCQLDNTAI